MIFDNIEAKITAAEAAAATTLEAEVTPAGASAAASPSTPTSTASTSASASASTSATEQPDRAEHDEVVMLDGPTSIEDAPLTSSNPFF
jgi:hypothetical protein